jgi:hypothetical protein
MNLMLLPAPEWAGFDMDWLSKRILERHRFGKRLPLKWLDPYANAWWWKLRAGGARRQ